MSIADKNFIFGMVVGIWISYGLIPLIIDAIKKKQSGKEGEHG